MADREGGSDLRLRLDSESVDECAENSGLEDPQPPPPRNSRSEKPSIVTPALSKNLSKEVEFRGEAVSFQEQLRAIAFGGSRQKRPIGTTDAGGGVRRTSTSSETAQRRVEKPAQKVEKPATEAATAAAMASGEEQLLSTLDLIAKLRDSLSAYQTPVAPTAPVENDVDDYQFENYGDWGEKGLPLPQLSDGLYEAESDNYGYDRKHSGYDGNGYEGYEGYDDDANYSGGVGYSGNDYGQQQQQQPGSMLQAVRARWAAQREEEKERLREMSSQRQLESQLREECRQLNENLHEKQLEVQAMADQLDLLRRLNDQTKHDLLAAVEKGDFQASELKLVMEEDRQVLEATRHENLELKAKIEGDELEMRGLEGRLAGLERQLQSLQSENGRLAQQMRETTLSVQAGAMERQEAGRLGQQLVALETELMRLRREVANQQLVSAADSRRAATAAAAIASAPPKPTKMTATASTMTTPRVAIVERPATAAGTATRLQRALQVNLTAMPASVATIVEPQSTTAPPPPRPLRQKQLFVQQQPEELQPQPMPPAPPPPLPRPQRSPEDEQISSRVRGFLQRLQTPPPRPPAQTSASHRPMRAAPMQQRLQVLQQQNQQPQRQQKPIPQQAQQPVIRRLIRSGSFEAGGSAGSTIVERLRAEFRDAHSAELKRLATASAAADSTKQHGPPTQPVPPSISAVPPSIQQSSSRPCIAGQAFQQQQPPRQQQPLQRGRSTASSMSNILQGLEALNSFRSGAGGVASSADFAVPRLSLETGAGGESMCCDSRWNQLRDYAEARELTASARKYADSLVTKYLSQQG